MKIPSREIQEKVFGHYSEEIPPEGSIKAKAYEILADPRVTDEMIEGLKQTFQKINNTIQEKIINPSIEWNSKLN